MPLPTLLLPDKIVFDDPSDQEKYKDVKAIDYIMDWFKVRLSKTPNTHADRILLLNASTGSGKSTTIGPELFLRFHSQLGIKRNIVVTEPKVLIAIEKAIEISDIPAYGKYLKLGNTTGYQTGAFKKKPRNPGVIFSTVGTLYQQFKAWSSNDFLNKYSVVVIDEVHDRSIDVDMLLFMMKEFINNHLGNRLCPFFVMMSATFDTAKFAKYFDLNLKTNMIRVVGLSYPIKKNFIKYTMSDFRTTVSSITEDIVKKDQKEKSEEACRKEDNDILVFISGMRQIDQLKKTTNELNKTLKYKLMPLSLTSGDFKKMSEDYIALTKPLSELRTASGKIPTRRIIFSTSVAEVGLTIPTLKYCMDLGLDKTMLYDSSRSSNIFITQAVTQSKSKQRMGRVGRVKPGEWWGLYTEKTYNHFKIDAPPSILTEEFTLHLLNIIIIQTDAKLNTVAISSNEPSLAVNHDGYFEPDKIKLLDKLTASTVRDSLDKLYILGYVNNDYKPTMLGIFANKFRKMRPETIRFLFEGLHLSINTNDLATIAAFLELPGWKSSSGLIYNKKVTSCIDEKVDGDTDTTTTQLYGRYFIADEFIEPVFVLEEITEILRKDPTKLNDYGKSKRINIYTIMTDIISQREEILTAIQEMNVGKVSHQKITDALCGCSKNYVKLITDIKRAIYAGFMYNIATWDENAFQYKLDYKNEYVTVRSPLIIPLKRDNSHKIAQLRPKKIIISNLLISPSPISKTYKYNGSIISVIDGFINIDQGLIVS